ncbi:MAG: sulfatase activating formylglycine-generating enzyme [Cognaticolwellia sp.]|jgi:formylglycine-generating enzyme required for sulfatase activity
MAEGLDALLDSLERRGLSSGLRAEVEQLLVDAVQPKMGEWPELDPARFRIGAPLGAGGMGQVSVLEDRLLGRRLAWKEALNDDGIWRLRNEAIATAQLDHPGVVPVVEMGRVPGHGPGYAMRLLERHVTLGLAFDELAQAGEPRWSFRRLVEALARVAETLEYAHRKGWVHRDIKPENIMLGLDGEVLVVDWGLAKQIEGAQEASRPTAKRGQSERLTEVGEVVGTREFMSPERLRDGAVEAAWDVYSLGCTLGLLLGLGVGERGVVELEGLASACQERAPLRPSAGGLALLLRRWLDGLQHQEMAEARWNGQGSLESGLQDAVGKMKAAQRALEEGVPQEGAAMGGPRALALQEASRKAAVELEQAEAQRLEGLATVLSLDPGHSGAQSAADALWIARHQRARDHLEEEAASLALHSLRLRGSRLALEYLGQKAQLDLRTEPPGATVLIRAIDKISARWGLGEARVHTLSGAGGFELSPGHYQLEVRHPQADPIRLALKLDRGARATRTLRLPERGSLRAGECWIPEGEFWAGGGEGDLPRRVWLPGFSIQKQAVSIGEYLRFLNAGRDAYGWDLDSGHVLRLFDFLRIQLGRPMLRLGKAGFELDPEVAPGWNENHPAVYLCWDSALAYSAWWSEVDGRRWRLPYELEWEKAGRGEDGRPYPWGSHFDRSFTVISGSREAARESSPEPVDTPGFDADRSPYGVRMMAGNTSVWCLDRWLPWPSRRRDRFDLAGPRPGVERAFRGGHWYSDPRPLWYRAGMPPGSRLPTLGIRLVRPREGEPLHV